MKLVQFYRGEIPTDDGDFLADIFTWSYEKLEGCHSYVQWAFPLVEGSMFHPEAPRLTQEEITLFREDPALREKFREAFYKILDFYGMEMQQEPRRTIKFQQPGRHKDPLWWLRSFNHNFLRITRILRCLRYMGLDEECKLFFERLCTLQHMVSGNSFHYWLDAAEGELPSPQG